jgi:predicted Rdx family selenoprotein
VLRLYLKNKLRAKGLAQEMVEHLPSKLKALHLIPGIAKKFRVRQNCAVVTSQADGA